MPDLDGIAAIERLPSDAKILVLTTFSGDAQVYAAFRAGASGYLLKTAPPEQLVTAVRTVAAGDAPARPTHHPETDSGRGVRAFTRSAARPRCRR